MWKSWKIFFQVIFGFGLVRPAPAAAASFALFGLAIAVLGGSNSVMFKRLTIWTCGALALGLYAMVLGSYATGFMRHDDWGNANVMAVNTILGLTFLGLGLFSTQFMHGPRLVDDVLLPLPVLLIVAEATLIFWLALTTQREHAARNAAALMAQSLTSSDSLIHIKAPIRALERIKWRWENQNGMPYEEWKPEADAQIHSEKIFVAIEWADPTGRVVWCRPESVAQKIVGFNFHQDTRWDSAAILDRAYGKRAMALSPTIDLQQGGSGFIVYLPLFPGGTFGGWLIGVVRIKDLMSSAIEAAGLADESISIFEDGRLILGPEPPPKDAGAAQAEATVDFYGRSWRFVVTPRQSAVVGHNLPAATLVLGFLLAGALAATVHGFQESVWKNREIHAANQQLERYANEDYLTGIFNRRYFDQLLENEIRRARRGGRKLAVVMADVDFFKSYNELYGHLAGDECLRRVAAVFQEAARRSSDFVGRYGGEEFCGVLAETDAHGAREFAEKVRAALQALGLPHASNPAGCVTASFGVASMDFSDGQPVNPAPGKHLIAQADAALYAAKNAGRNTVCCESKRPDA